MGKDKGHIKTDIKLEKLERKISREYSKSKRVLQKKIESKLSILKKWDTENEKLKKENGEEFKRRRQTKLFEIDKNEKVVRNLATDLLILNQKVTDFVNDASIEIYAINHNYILGEIVKNGANITFEFYNKNSVYNLIKNDGELFPKRNINIAKDLLWNEKKIKSELIKAIIQGKSTREIARDFQKITDMNKTSSIRNAQTSVTNVENKARIDGFKYAESLGVELRKKWVATSDTHTRSSHALLNGSIVDTNEHFENGLMYPGDPGGRPEEVYNCRCTVVSELKKDYR